jgi:replicative DNA helicase
LNATLPSTNGKHEPLTKPVPYDLEAERDLLAACLSEPAQLLDVMAIVEADDFYLETNRWIYEALLALHQRRVQIDVVPLLSEIRRRGRLDQTKAQEYVRALYAGTLGVILHSATNARAVADAAAERRMIKAGGYIAALGYETDRSVDERAAEAEEMVFNLRPRRAVEEIGLDQAINAVIDDLDADKPATGITTGFETLDLLTSGWQPTDLILLAARPSNGKSSLALEFALAAAANGVHVQFFSLEMSPKQLAMRALARLAGVDLQRIRSRLLSRDDNTALVSVQGEASAMASRIHIDPNGGQSIGKIRAAMRLAKHRYGAGLVILDYVQLAEGIRKGKSDNQNNEVATITRGLKLEAVALDVPVIALSQMSRAVESRADHKPQLSDLRDSGALEQDADMVMFIYRPELYENNPEKKVALSGKAWLSIQKQRNGPLGDVPLLWHPERTQFEQA